MGVCVAERKGSGFSRATAVDTGCAAASAGRDGPSRVHVRTSEEVSNSDFPSLCMHSVIAVLSLCTIRGV